MERNPHDLVILVLIATGNLTMEEISTGTQRSFEEDSALAVELLETHFGVTMDQFETIADALVKLAGLYEGPSGEMLYAFSSPADDDEETTALLYPTSMEGKAIVIQPPHLH